MQQRLQLQLQFKLLSYKEKKNKNTIQAITLKLVVNLKIWPIFRKKCCICLS